MSSDQFVSQSQMIFTETKSSTVLAAKVEQWFCGREDVVVVKVTLYIAWGGCAVW